MKSISFVYLSISIALTIVESSMAQSLKGDPAAEKRREEIPMGGDFKPDLSRGTPAFVVVGHGGRIILSKDDGKTWEQVFFGYPAADHSAWATKSVAYSGGVFVVAVGWGAPTSYLASEDGRHWRHLTAGTSKISDAKGNPRVMPGTWGLAAGDGTFVGTGFMTTCATSDLGRSFSTFSLYQFRNDPRGYKLSTHHLDPIYCGDATGRFLALGDNRGQVGPKFGHLFASDDRGKTWRWLMPEGLDASTSRGALATNGDRIVMTDREASNAWFSIDGGEHWDGPHTTGTKRAVLSAIGNEFWLCGKPSRVSSDGKQWRDLPASVPLGQVIASDKNTLISIHQQRFNILRSHNRGETWEEVYNFEPEDISGGAQGLRDGAFGWVSERF